MPIRKVLIFLTVVQIWLAVSYMFFITCYISAGRAHSYSILLLSLFLLVNLLVVPKRYVLLLWYYILLSVLDVVVSLLMFPESLDIPFACQNLVLTGIAICIYYYKEFREFLGDGRIWASSFLITGLCFVVPRLIHAHMIQEILLSID